MKLPVFKVASSIAPADHIRELGQRIFPRQDHQIVERGTRIELRSPLGQIEVDTGKGGVWAADNTRLWRFDPASGKTPRLMGAPEARKLGMDVLKAHQIVPELAGPFKLKTPRATGAVTAFSARKGGPRQVIHEDNTVIADVEVDVSDHGLKQKTLPVVGGGGRFSAVFGDGGSLLAAGGVWRPSIGKPVLHDVIPQKKADEQFKARMGNTPVSEFSSELAYYAAPAFAEQSMMYPVYVYSAVADFKGKRVPLRKIMIPATDVGPTAPAATMAPPRSSKTEPHVRPLPADFMPVPGKALPPGIALNKRMMLGRKLQFADYFVPGPANTPLVVNPNLTQVQLKELANMLGYYSAGTSWIGLSGGLSGSQNNAKGFVDELAAIGWNIRFNWGDAAAWESDWRRNDDNWVDAVDFVFYTGHANSDGWVLATPDDTFLHFTETAGARDLWGANNLEWAVIAACGPLQDEAVESGGDVLERWRDAFDGLHILMGYAQVTYDTEEEGKRLAQYAKSGASIVQSWFRTGQEIQGAGIWVGACYLGNASGSTSNDHLWGVGSVGPDITSPTWRACSWVPC